MDFHTFGDVRNPSVLLIHGGGCSWWGFLRQARSLSERYHVVVPTLDGHGSERSTPYLSTEDCADKLMAYIDEHLGGHVFALCGVSLGGQIVVELLSRRPDVATKAIVDGSLLYPKPLMAWFCIAVVRCFGRLIFSEKACRRQLDAMPRMLPESMQFPREIREYYLEDMPFVPTQTLITMYRTYMGGYRLKDDLRKTNAAVSYWYGEKEMRCVKKSALLFKALVPTCEIREARGYDHGYLALYLPDEWVRLAGDFFEREPGATE